MSASDLVVKANKRARGQILTLLYSVHPVPVEVRTITTSLIENSMSNGSDIARHIDYLSGKEYITIKSEEDAAQMLRGIVPPSAFVKLTPKGIDLIEETIEDAGVDV